MTTGTPPELFIDGPAALHVAGGMARLELYALETSKRSLRDEQTPVTVLRLVLPPEGFLQIFETISAFMAEQGIEPAPAGAEVVPFDRPVASPNFPRG